MANSLYKTPGFSPQVKHNGFDMSMRRLFTAPVGMMLPVYTDIVQANDKYKLNVDAFIRTEAVQTAAFQNFRAHFDWFFVPFRQLYQYWNEFYNGTFDVNTNYVKVSDNYSLPTTPFDFSPDFLSSDQATKLWYIDVKPNQGQYTTVDEFGSSYLGNAVRLADLLGYGDLHRFATGTFPGADKFSIFPYKYLAYHKIFYHPKFNRGDWFERKNELFNVDSYHGTTIPAQLAARIFSTVHYRPYRRDYFSGVFPNPVFSKDYANIVGDSWILSQYAVNKFSPEVQFADGPVNLGLWGSNGASGLGNVKLYMETPDSPSIDVDTLNALYDFDKLCRITALAGSHYTDQLEAHFGITVNNDIHNEADFIGSQSLDISISEVVSTATTGAKDSAGSSLSGVNLGDIAGKGFGASSRQGDLNFHAKEQGVLMCVFSIEPLQMYSSKLIERNGLYKEPLDFFRRELDNLGMQPMLQAELNDNFPDVSPTDDVIGYNYRYSELKTKVDLVNLGFTTVKTDWQCNFQDAIGDRTLSRQFRFYINPSYTDNIFLQHYSRGQYRVQQDTTGFTDWSDYNNMQIFKGDNFLINAQFNVLKDSIMSVHSLPSLN